MSKPKIPVYDICNLSKEQLQQNDLLVERFGAYLKRQPDSLHHAHRHSFYHLVLFTKGSGSHTIDFTHFKVKPFEMYFMIPGQVHSWQFDGEVDGYIVNFADIFFRPFLLNPNYLERFHFFGGISEESVFQLPVEIQDKVTQLFEEIIATPGNLEENALDMARLLLIRLFIIIDNALKGKSQIAVPRQKLVFLKNFRKLIDQHYLSKKLPKEYADLLYVTPNHLNALSQDLLGKTAGELIRDRVLLEAKRLLTSTEMSISEISSDLNFQDNSYFNRYFKKYAGVTPDEFRKQHLKK